MPVRARKGEVHADALGEPVTGVALSHDGQCVVASCLEGAGGGGAVRLLELGTGQLLNDYRGHAHASFALESCLSRTDAHVLSGSEDGRVLAWRLVEGAVAVTLRAHKRAVCSLACHPTESCVLAASHDGTVSVWDRSEAPSSRPAA